MTITSSSPYLGTNPYPRHCHIAYRKRDLLSRDNVLLPAELSGYESYGVKAKSSRV